MSEEKKPVNLFLQKLKQKTADQKHYGGKAEEKAAEMGAKDCPNCGAGRAKHDGVTHCAYCSFEFIKTKITKGLHIDESDNSKT